MSETIVMAGDTVTVPKPMPVKPKPITPKPITPKPITPKKAHGGGTTKHCIRCKTGITAETGVVRKLCSACDLELQTMHWQNEWSLFRKVIYIPEGTEPSVEWLNANGYDTVLRKPPNPYRRSFFRHPPAATLSC